MADTALTATDGIFQSIPNDHCAARYKAGRFLMVDLTVRPRRGKVWAKAYGKCPEVTTAANALRTGMQILGGVVGIYQTAAI